MTRSAFVVNRRAAILRVLLYLGIAMAIGFAAGRVSASRSAATDIPATANGPSTAAGERESEPSPLSWGPPSSVASVAPSRAAVGPRPSPRLTLKRQVVKAHVPNRVTPSGRSGTASWYAANGLIGAVNSWRWGNRPYYVRVCASRCIGVLVQDHCAGCTGSRLIDLSDDAFRLLAPLSRGIIRVWVTQW